MSTVSTHAPAFEYSTILTAKHIDSRILRRNNISSRNRSPRLQKEYRDLHRYNAKPDYERYFTGNRIIASIQGKTKGRAKDLARFAAIAKHAREELRPIINVVSEGNLAVFEIDACFMPHEDQSGWIHEFKEGQAVASHPFAIYVRSLWAT